MKEEIGIRIRIMRKSHRMTQEDLSNALGQSASSITMYETGRRSPDYETLEALADIFNVPLSYIVGSNDGNIQSETFQNYLKTICEDKVEQDLLNTYRSLTLHGKNLLIERAKELKLLYGKKSEGHSAESI